MSHDSSFGVPPSLNVFKVASRRASLVFLKAGGWLSARKVIRCEAFRIIWLLSF